MSPAKSAACRVLRRRSGPGDRIKPLCGRDVWNLVEAKLPIFTLPRVGVRLLFVLSARLVMPASRLVESYLEARDCRCQLLDPSRLPLDVLLEPRVQDAGFRV